MEGLFVKCSRLFSHILYVYVKTCSKLSVVATENQEQAVNKRCLHVFCSDLALLLTTLLPLDL